MNIQKYKIYYSNITQNGGNWDCKDVMLANMPNICKRSVNGDFASFQECATAPRCINKWYRFKQIPVVNPKMEKKMDKIQNFVDGVILPGTLSPPKSPSYEYEVLSDDLIKMKYSGFESHPECISKYMPKYPQNTNYSIVSSINIKKLMSAISRKPGIHLFIVSDFHGHQNPESISMMILKNNPNIERVFLEFDYRVQRALDDYIIDGNMDNLFNKIPYLLRSLKDVYIHCRENNIQLICTDSYPLGKSKTNDNDLCRRNKFMADSINNAPRPNPNASELFIVGGRHIEYEFSVVFHLLPNINKYFMSMTTPKHL